MIKTARREQHCTNGRLSQTTTCRARETLIANNRDKTAWTRKGPSATTMYITQLYILFLVTDLVSSSLLLHISDVTVGCTRSLRGANLTVALSLYTDRTSASRSLSFYNNTVDYYVAESGRIFSFAISNDTTVILLKANATLLMFDGSVMAYRGDAILLSLNAYKWDGQTTATLNASFSDPLLHSFPSMRLDTRNSFKWECAANWHGFTCSKFCKPFNDSWRCYTCEPITGEEVCCTGIIPKTEKCWRNATLATTATNKTPTVATCTGISTDHADLYFWLAIGLACFSLLMVLVAATVTILAVHFYRNSKRAVLAARYTPYPMSYAISNEAPRTTHLEETLDSETGPKDNFSYSYTLDDTLDSWPREIERREARV